MEIPFTYGKIVSDNDFTDRVEETQTLVSNFLSQTNTVLISPRRWGKSSLVNRAVNKTAESDHSILFVRMNAFKCETPQDFYELFAKRVIEDISSFADSFAQYTVSFGVDFKTNPINEDILDLPQQIASRRNRKVIVCIDEFQQIGEFEDTKAFQKTVRSHWQEQPDVAYILYGSKKHMMLNIFGEYESPLYKFGDMMFLPKISNEDWSAYIQDRFAKTGKKISKDTASYIAALVEEHSYYVQQLAQYAWLRTESECTVSVVDAAFQAMLDSLNLQFVNLMDTMTEKQRSFLCALSDGVRNLSATDTLSRYRLGTSGNIRILKGALKKRDLIEESGHQVEIQDPVFKKWLQRIYKTI